MNLTYSINNLNDVADILFKKSKNKTWLFNGSMGAGKTTLIKALAKKLGVTNMANSPTFSIVNEYLGTKDKVYHFDLYRLKNENEAYDMGLEEYFYDNAWCFVEWPNLAQGILPPNVHIVNISVIDEHTRELNFE